MKRKTMQTMQERRKDWEGVGKGRKCPMAEKLEDMRYRREATTTMMKRKRISLTTEVLEGHIYMVGTITRMMEISLTTEDLEGYIYMVRTMRRMMEIGLTTED